MSPDHSSRPADSDPNYTVDCDEPVWSPEIDPQNQNFDGSARCRSAIPTHNQHLDGMRWVATLRDVARRSRATLRDRGGDAYPAARVEGSRHADECDRA